MHRVLLLHSGGMTSRQWSRLAGRLRDDGLETVAPDFHGHGEGPPWPERPSAGLAPDLELVASLVDGPTHLVGHSYGGLIALLVAAGRDDVTSVSVYEPIAFGTLLDSGDDEALADLRRLGADPRFLDPAALGTDPWLERFVDYWSGDGAWARLGERGQASFRASAPALAVGVPHLMADRTPVARYRDVAAPLLVLRGDQGPLSARHAAALVADAAPLGRLQTIAGAGHMGPLTHRDAVDGLIADHVLSSTGR